MNRFLLCLGLICLSTGLAMFIGTGFDRLAILLGATVPNMSLGRTEVYLLSDLIVMIIGSVFTAYAFPKKAP